MHISRSKRQVNLIRLYADDLVIIAESLEECVWRLLTWTEAMEKKGLRVNAGKVWAATASSAMAASTGCTRNAVGSSAWKKTLTTDARELHGATRCQGTACPLNGKPQKEVQVGPDKLEVVASFCYLGDMLSATGGCELSTTTRVKTAWKKFKDLLPVLSSRHLSFKTRGCVYSQLLCAERNAPSQRDLAIDKAKPPAFAAKWQGNDQTDLQCQTARHCHHQVQWATCAAWHWGSGPHSEGEKTPMVWTCGTLQWCSQDSLWHTGWWKAWACEAQDHMETADREGLQRVEALAINPSW